MTTCRCCGGLLEAATLSDAAFDRSPVEGQFDGGFDAEPSVDLSITMPDVTNSAGSSAPFWVEANVLACCNAAYDRAERGRGDEVTLLDLLHAITSAPTLAAWLAAFDVDRDLLRIEIEATPGEELAASAAVDGFGAALAPRTGWEMRHVLTLAREAAERREAPSLGIGDVLTAILDYGLGPAGRLLVEHVARQRQRRRGGGRASRQAVNQFGAFDPVWDARSVHARHSADDSDGPWIDDRRASLTASFDDHAASEAGDLGAEPDGDRHGSPMIDRTSEFAPSATVPSGFTARQEALPAARRDEDRRGGGDDLYRPGESEPSDGWRAGAAPPLDEATTDTPAPGADPSLRREILRGQLMVQAELRRLMAQIETWRADMLARLDEQGLQMEELQGRMPEPPGLTLVAATRDNAGTGESATSSPSTVRAILPASGPARQEPNPKISEGATVAGQLGKLAGAYPPKTQAVSAAAACRAYLSRSEIRADMGRTLGRRRELRQIAAEVAAKAEADRREKAARAARAQLATHAAAQGQHRASAASQSGEQAGVQSGGGMALRMAVPGGAQGGQRGAPMTHVPLTIKSRARDEEDDGDEMELGGQVAKRFYLSIDDDIVDAPSIGPRTAERLREHGIHKVRDLLAHKAQALSARVGVRHITAERITSWQHQARLVCTIPWLRGTHAQILVGSGYYQAHSIVTANRDALCTAILRFATTREGQSVLRSSPPPSMGKIMGWVEQAARAELDRAA